MQDLSTKITGSNLSAAEFVEMVLEIQNIITDNGLTLAAGSDQLGDALANFQASGNFYSETGIADVYVATKIGTKRGLERLASITDGALIRFRPGNDNTGASTLAVNGLAAKDILREDGSTPLAGDLSTERDVTVRYDYNGGSDRFFLLNAAGSSFMPRGYIDGLILSNDAVDTDHDIEVAPGITVDSAGKITMELGVAITKQIDGNWAAGDNQPGLATGSVANATWYHMFLIRENATGTIDAGFDTNLDASALLSASSYDQYRRIGAVLTDGSANIQAFTQEGESFFWVVPTLDVDLSTLGDAEALAELLVPLGVKVQAFMNAITDHADSARSVWIYNPDHTSATPGTAAAPLANTRIGGSGEKRMPFGAKVLTDTSSQVAVRSSGANTELRIVTLGWDDPRGRNA